MTVFDIAAYYQSYHV